MDLFQCCKLFKWLNFSPTKVLALDCEMVGVGPAGRDHMLARVTLVNIHGNVIYDRYVKPREAVVDYRTRISGIRPENLQDGEYSGLTER